MSLILCQLHVIDSFLSDYLQEAADLGAKVAVLDFVKPTEKGTTWGEWVLCIGDPRNV